MKLANFAIFFKLKCLLISSRAHQTSRLPTMKDLYDKLLVTETLKFSYHKAVYYFSRQAKTRRNTKIAKISYFSSFLNL